MLFLVASVPREWGRLLDFRKTCNVVNKILLAYPLCTEGCVCVEVMHFTWQSEAKKAVRA